MTSLLISDIQIGNERHVDLIGAAARDVKNFLYLNKPRGVTIDFCRVKCYSCDLCRAIFRASVGTTTVGVAVMA